MKTFIETDKAPAPVGPYSQAVLIDGFLYCSGQIPIVPESGELLTGAIESQALQVMKNIGAVLDEAGFAFKDVIKTAIFLTDLGDFSKVNAIYADYFSVNPPARSCVQVAALPKGVNVEIEVIARKA